MADLALYLTLAPEFGGRRFGPFEGLEVRLGTDAQRCHIVLAEGFGVVRDHCKVVRQGPTNLILTPSERTAAVWLWRAGAPRPVQVQAPTAVRTGDWFSLVTPDGPRFYVELAPLPADLLAQRRPGKRTWRNLTPQRFFREAWSLFVARLYTFNPIAVGARLWYFVVSGAIWQPRYIILGFLALTTMISTGVGSCRVWQLTRERDDLTKERDNAKADCDAVKNLGKDVEKLSFADLAPIITHSPTLARAMANDQDFASQLKQEARAILQGPQEYTWVWEATDAAAAFRSFRTRVEEDKSLDASTKLYLSYLALGRNRTNAEWGVELDSQGRRACGRGPLRLTWRQAHNLELAPQLDTYVSGDSSVLANDALKRAEALNAAAAALAQPPLVEGVTSEVVNIVTGADACAVVEGADERKDTGALLSMLHTQLGAKAQALPATDDALGAVARIARLFSADIPDLQYLKGQPPRLDFTRGTLGGPLKDYPGGDWVMQHTAEVVARSIVLPCLGVLERDPKDVQKVLGENLPNPIHCLVLDYDLRKKK